MSQYFKIAINFVSKSDIVYSILCLKLIIYFYKLIIFKVIVKI